MGEADAWRGTAIEISTPADRSPEDERSALELLEAGDRRGALTLLMREHGDAVFNRAVRVIGERSSAEDVLQQTFLEAFRDLPSLRSRSSVKAWLLGIATHRALDAARRLRRETDRVETHGSDPYRCAPIELVGQLNAAQRARVLEGCLAELSPEVRAAVLMRFQGEQSYEEMAETLQEKPGTLQARVVRAMPVLRRCLESKGVGP